MGDISGLLHIQSSKIAYQFFSTSFQTNHQIFIEAYYIRIFSFGFKGWKKFSGSRLKLKMGGGVKLRCLLSCITAKPRD